MSLKKIFLSKLVPKIVDMIPFEAVIGYIGVPACELLIKVVKDSDNDFDDNLLPVFEAMKKAFKDMQDSRDKEKKKSKTVGSSVGENKSLHSGLSTLGSR